MRLEFNKTQLENELNRGLIAISADIRQEVEAPFTADILSKAAPIIETLLKTASILPTKGSLRQFYDEQSDIAKTAAGWRVPKNTTDPHLMEMWEVDWELSKRDNVGKILVSNRKQVKGRDLYFDLFALLWEGTDTYVAPVQLNQEQITRLKRERDRHGNPLMERWSRDKERWLMLVSKYKRTRVARQTKSKRMYYEGEVESNASRKKSQSDMWKETHEQTVVGHDPYQFGSTDFTKTERAGLTSSGLKKQARTNYIMSQPERTIKGKGKGGFRKGKTYYMGKHGAKFPHLQFELYDIGGEDKSYHQGLAHYMHFYNRFKGRFYWNQLVRKGIEGKVLEDFHSYVSGCILRGMNIALGEVSDETVEDIYNESRFTR